MNKTKEKKICWYCSSNLSSSEHTEQVALFRKQQTKNKYLFFYTQQKITFEKTSVNIPVCKTCHVKKQKTFWMSFLLFIALSIPLFPLSLVFSIPVSMAVNWILANYYYKFKNNKESYPEILSLLMDGWEIGDKPYATNDEKFNFGKNIKYDYKKKSNTLEEDFDFFCEQAKLLEKNNDYINALKYYNLIMDQLGDSIYFKLKDKLFLIEDIIDKQLKNDDWYKLATETIIKNSSREEIKSVMFATPKTVNRILEKNRLYPYKEPWEDKGGIRYVLPSYFNAFKEELKKNKIYSITLNKVGELFVKMGKFREAKKLFHYSMEFIPEDFKYDLPLKNIKELELVKYLLLKDRQ